MLDIQNYLTPHYFRATALDVARCNKCFFPVAAGVQGDPALPLVPCKCGGLARPKCMFATHLTLNDPGFE